MGKLGEKTMTYLFDQVFQDFITSIGSQKTVFPFYNIVSTDEKHFELQLALAGYKMEDVQINLEGDQLIVYSNGANDKDVRYAYKGFTTKPFMRKFVLNSDVVVNGAELQDGILRILMERVVPERSKVRTIEINKPIKTILHG
jgi:molecular chaperone IbpA